MITANLKTYRQSPRKVRLVSDLVKGKSVPEALRLLAVTTKSATLPLRKLLQSAIKSAKNSFDIAEENLYVKDFRVDAGATLKRSMPRSRGRAFPILKRTCHVTLVLGEQAEGKGQKSKVKITSQNSKV